MRVEKGQSKRKSDRVDMPTKTSTLLAVGSGSKVYEWGVLTKSTGHNDTYQDKGLTIPLTKNIFLRSHVASVS